MSERDGPLPMPPPEVRAVALLGPTAAGKSALGLSLARRLALPVLVCDSVKVYRGLDIGSAKPDAVTRAAVPHALLDLVDPDQPFSAGDYAQAAWTQLRAHGGRGLFVGGTGFYLRAVGWTMTGGDAPGLDSAPDEPARARHEARLREREREQPGAIHRALAAVDPTLAATIHPRNLVRLLRALWLTEVIGGPVSAQRDADPPRARLRLMLVVLDPGPEALGPRILARLDRMLARGFLAEVEKLHAAGYHAETKSMRSLGYRQMLDVVQGRSTLEQARAAIALATRQYAKRQRTYFRSQLPAERVVTIVDPAQCPFAELEAFLRDPAPPTRPM